MKEKVIATNRKAYHFYDIEETIEAGIVLTGSEIKSIREGKASVNEGFARLERGELWLFNMHISPYDKGGINNPDPRRPRKLLLRKKEIERLAGKILQRGYTLIPLRLYIKGRWAKVELGLARGKKMYDRRREIAERDTQREMERMIKGR